MNHVRRFLNSGLKRNIGLASMFGLAAVFTIPRAGTDTNPVQAALLKDVMSSATAAASLGWDLPNIDNHRVDSWVTLFSTDPRVKARFATWLDRGRWPQ